MVAIKSDEYNPSFGYAPKIMTKLILKNAHLITMDPQRPEASACAIENGKICWVGDAKDCPDGNVLDLKGAYVYPGFIDSHAHIFYTGHHAKHQLNLFGCKSKQEVFEKVKEHLQTLKPGDWLLGFGWDEHLWQEAELPTNKELDAISTQIPILLRRVDTHAVWVNSKALSIAGITSETANPIGGKILPGILIDQAEKLLTRYLPKPTLELNLELTNLVLQDCLQQGITSIHNAALVENDLESYTALALDEKLPVRIYGMAMLPSAVGEAFLAQGPLACSPFFEVRCLKFFVDGAMGSRGAALMESYSDDPATQGLVLWSEEALLDKLNHAKEQGFQVAIHAIGDLANHIVLDAYEKVGVKNLRWRIEHAQLLDPKDVKRFFELGVIAAMQPLHLIEDMPWMEKRLGKKRVQERAFLWRSLLDAKAIIAGGSDAPVVDINPFLGLYAAITRQNLQGHPEEGWQASERVSSYEALQMYTTHAAYAQFREHELGSITPSKLADLIVLPENLLTCAPKALLNMKVLLTIVNGKVAYDAGKL